MAQRSGVPGEESLQTIAPAIVTTSWDDGHPLDLRVAELLAAHGLRGTFYVTTRCAEFPALPKAQMMVLRRMGMEIGSHTVSHPQLTKLDDQAARAELVDSKKELEDILGAPVTAFCYPYGKFNRRLSELVQESGYQLARTTVAFRTSCDFEPALMPVSFQLVRHPYQIHLRHGLKEANGKGLMDWARLWHMERDLVRLSGRMLRHIVPGGGLMHMWGHSWEIDRLGLWDTLDTILRLVASHNGVVACTNSEVLKKEEVKVK